MKTLAQVREQITKEFPPTEEAIIAAATKRLLRAVKQKIKRETHIGNWNRHKLAEMSRNPNTRAHSSRT